MTWDSGCDIFLVDAFTIFLSCFGFLSQLRFQDSHHETLVSRIVHMYSESESDMTNKKQMTIVPPTQPHAQTGTCG